jgi:DNA repair protein RadC
MLEASEALEKLITLADPSADARVLAEALISRYGSLSMLLAAPPEDLTRVEGVRAPLAQLLRLLPSMARYDALDSFGPRPDVSTFRRAEGYMAALYVGRAYEHFFLLCLNSDGRLIRTALITRGTLDETAFYLRNMLDEALKAKAYAVVLAHNHPGGTSEPSQGDVSATRLAIRALSKVGVLVLDHAIIADGRALSMRAAGAIDESEFLDQAPGEALLRGWLG